MKPKLFVASSIEARQAAEQVRDAIGEWCDSEIWTEGFFRPGGSTSATIERRLSDFDGALFLLSPDDLLFSRGRVGPTPRANVLFELGMFAASLGLANCIQLVLKTEPTSWDETVAQILEVRGPAFAPHGIKEWSRHKHVEALSDLAGITYIELKAKAETAGERTTFSLTPEGVAKLRQEMVRLRSRDGRLLGSTLGDPPQELISYWEDGSSFSEEPIDVCVFGDRIRGRYPWAGDGKAYEIALQLDGENLLWGHWWHPHEVSYGGFAQFQVRARPSYLLGTWLGWSANGGVKSGRFIIARQSVVAAAKADSNRVQVAHLVHRFARQLQSAYSALIGAPHPRGRDR